MKKLTTICAALMFCLGVSAHDFDPGDDLSAIFKISSSTAVKAEKVTRQVRSAFNEKFAAATDVSWKQNKEYYFATFQLNDKAFTVAYVNDGNFVAISRLLTLKQIPIATLQALEERFAGYAIPDKVTEISMDGSTNYYLTIDSKTRTLLVKCCPNGTIDILDKSKKKVLIGKAY